MGKEKRTVCYDEELHIEAYRFEGIAQPFPNHFHDYYVIGLIGAGTRCLQCRGKEYEIRQGSILLLHPDDAHGCMQNDGKALDYLCLNIRKETMLSLVEEITGERKLIGFSTNVIENMQISHYFASLHSMIMEKDEGPEKGKMLLFLIQSLMEQYGVPFEECIPDCSAETEQTCQFMEKRFAEHITLEELCEYSHSSKSTLLRAFTRSRGVTPYRYLQAVRIGKAKELLANGAAPVEAAVQTGFADQSHFSDFFHRFIGLSPAAYRNIFKGNRREKGNGK